MEIKLGKIKEIEIRLLDHQFGIFYTFCSGSTHVQTCDVHFSKPPTERCKWTVEDQQNEYSQIFMGLCETMKEAGVTKFGQLRNIPVELTFDGNLLKKWRILTEVL